MKNYDDIVVGSGISGMTLALLLAMNGRSVLLLEKAPIIGGSMARFYREGVPLDTGFHFTGGFAKDGILSDMLKVLDAQNDIEPLFIEDENNNRFVFENNRRTYKVPLGTEEVKTSLKEYFPVQETAIDSYFEKVEKVCINTTSMDLRTITDIGKSCDEDFVTLRDTLDSLTEDKDLKTLLSAYTMCIGTQPSELSFAAYSRVCCSLYQSVARVKDGGDAFISLFKKKALNLNIEVRTKTYITECAEVVDRKVGKFVLNTGEEVSATQCTFTIHPLNVLETIQSNKLTKAFKDRVQEFEPSVGFFSVFATVENVEQFKPGIVSLYPEPDVERLFDLQGDSDSALVVMKNCEESNGKKFNVLNMFELSSFEDVEKWKNSKCGQRPKEYKEYKKAKTMRILDRVLLEFPEYKDKIKILDSASMLTFRDYLNTPFGCAYGIKQKIGQFNLFGKLPLKNLYVTGQSSVLPGLVGAMMSSFIIARSLIGKDDYNKFIENKLT